MITGNYASTPKFRFKPQIPLPFTSIPVKMENHWLHITVRVCCLVLPIILLNPTYYSHELTHYSSIIRFSVIIIIKIHCLQYKYSFVTNYTVTLHYTDSSVITYAVQCTCGKSGSFSMIITMIVAHCTDSNFTYYSALFCYARTHLLFSKLC